MAIHISLENDNKNLKRFSSQIIALTTQCESAIPTYFNGRSLNINLQVKAGQIVIPETGIGGYAPTKDEIQITIDPLNPFIEQHFEAVYLSTLYHEVHHCFRHATVGYGDTLFKGMLSEGLACHFEEETGHTQPIYVNHLPDKQRQHLIDKASMMWHQTPYDHVSWFFGNDKQDIPRWAAYDIGYYLVGQYLKQSKQTASFCHGVDSSKIFEVIEDMRN